MLGEIKIFIKYTFFGSIATLVDWGTFFLLNSYFFVHHVFAIIISYILGGIVKFLFAKKVVFKDKNKKYGTQIIMFIILNCVSLILSLFIIYLFVDIFLLNPLLSRIIITIIILIFNYMCDKLVVFNKKVYGV